MYKIYKISTKNSDVCYIGLTKAKYLSIRLNQHRYAMRKHQYCSSHEIIKFDDHQIELLDTVLNKQDGIDLEQEMINSHNCCNVYKKRRSII